MTNLLLEEVDYQIDRTRRGVWRRFLYPNGLRFVEYKSHARLWGLPVIHYTSGICPEPGRRIVARGVIAIGRLAVGGLAIGHASLGVIGIGQLGLGLVLGLGQASAGLYALGQLALGVQFGMGQLATGAVAIGQLAFGGYVLAQFGIGDFVWDQRGADPQAVSYFKSLWDRIASRF